MAGVAVFLGGRTWMAVAAVACGFLLHPTTAVWFAVLIGIAAVVSDRDSYQPMAAIAGGVAAAAAVLLASTLHEQLSIMSPAWKALLQSKDYLLATDWPMLTWFANLSLAAVIALVHDYRRSLGVATPRETGLVAGCGVLLLMFLVSVPLASAGIALVVQLQFNRVFWLLDLIAVCYAVWLVVESPLRASRTPIRFRVRRAAVALLVAAAMARGGYVTFVERAEHPLIQIDLPATEWTAVMRWAGERPVGTHFLADPGHAWRYGSSVRAASGRDVYLEEVKDVGIAIYSNRMAQRISSRVAELGDFSSLGPRRARWLARRHRLDYLITEHPIDLPLVHRNGRFGVYDLGRGRRPASRHDAPAAD